MFALRIWIFLLFNPLVVLLYELYINVFPRTIDFLKCRGKLCDRYNLVRYYTECTSLIQKGIYSIKLP